MEKSTLSDGSVPAVEYDARNEAGEKKVVPAYRDSMAAGNAANGLRLLKKYTMIW